MYWLVATWPEVLHDLEIIQEVLHNQQGQSVK